MTSLGKQIVGSLKVDKKSITSSVFQHFLRILPLLHCQDLVSVIILSIE